MNNISLYGNNLPHHTIELTLDYKKLITNDNKFLTKNINNHSKKIYHNFNCNLLSLNLYNQYTYYYPIYVNLNYLPNSIMNISIQECKNIKFTNIPNSIKHIDFDSNRSFKKITLPYSLNLLIVQLHYTSIKVRFTNIKTLVYKNCCNKNIIINDTGKNKYFMM